MTTAPMLQDGRIAAIMLNLNVRINTKAVLNNYTESSIKISEAQQKKCTTYKNLKQTIKESYLLGSAKYGNNYIM